MKQEAADELDYRLGHVHKEFRPTMKTQPNTNQKESAPSETVRQTVAEQIEVSMRSALRDIQTQCQFVIENSTNADLVAFAKLIARKAERR